MSLLNCKEIPGKPGWVNYAKAKFDPEKRIVKWGKYSHFKKGDFYRMRGIHGQIIEAEITEIHEGGIMEITTYSTMRWYQSSKKKLHTRGCNTHDVGLIAICAETMFADIQERGFSFHKIKKLSKKHRLVKVHYDTNW